MPPRRSQHICSREYWFAHLSSNIFMILFLQSTNDFLQSIFAARNVGSIDIRYMVLCHICRNTQLIVAWKVSFGGGWENERSLKGLHWTLPRMKPSQVIWNSWGCTGCAYKVFILHASTTNAHMSLWKGPGFKLQWEMDFLLIMHGCEQPVLLVFVYSVDEYLPTSFLYTRTCRPLCHINIYAQIFRLLV